MIIVKFKLTIGRDNLPVVEQGKQHVYLVQQSNEESRTYPSAISSQSATRGTTLRDVMMYGMTLYSILHQYLQ